MLFIWVYFNIVNNETIIDVLIWVSVIHIIYHSCILLSS